MASLTQFIITAVLIYYAFHPQNTLGMSIDSDSDHENEQEYKEEHERKEHASNIFHLLPPDQQERMVESFFVATNIGDLEGVTSALNAGVPVNAYIGWADTALACAIHKNHTALVELLLNNNADPNACSAVIYRNTPLQWAAIHGNTRIVKALLTHKADINDKPTYKVKNISTFYETTILSPSALYLAAKHHHDSIVKILIFANTHPLEIKCVEQCAQESMIKTAENPRYETTYNTIITAQQEKNEAITSLETLENAQPLFAHHIPIPDLVHFINDYAIPYYPDNDLLNEFIEQQITQNTVRIKRQKTKHSPEHHVAGNELVNNELQSKHQVGQQYTSATPPTSSAAATVEPEILPLKKGQKRKRT